METREASRAWIVRGSAVQDLYDQMGPLPASAYVSDVRYAYELEDGVKKVSLTLTFEDE